MEKKDNIYQNNSVGDLLEQIDADQHYKSLQYQSQDLGMNFQSNQNFQMHRQNVYYNEQVAQTEQRSSLPFIFNTREDVVPTMVGVGGGNFMVFGTPTAERNANGPNHANVQGLHFASKASPKLSGLSNYVDRQADYNLFSGGIGMNSVGVQFNSQQEPSSSGTPHLLESLVGQLGSDKSGTYSPFGSSLGSVHSQQHGFDRPPIKTRIVAEVRPMRPSYSDVLTKPVPCPKQGKASDGKIRNSEVKSGRFGKPGVGRSHSGTGNFNRHNLSVGDEPASSGSNSSLKTAEVKSLNEAENSEHLTKKWVSLDDLTAGVNDDENNFVSEAKEKKMNNKHFKQLNKLKDMWSNNSLDAEKLPGTKSLGAKKNNISPKTLSAPREKEASFGIKFEPTKTKAHEERKNSSQGKASDSTKANRRSSRTVPGEKGKKTGRSKRREVGGGWPALLVNRFDFVAAYVVRAVRWLITLVLDVVELSTNLGVYMCTAMWCSSVTSCTENYDAVRSWFRDLALTRYLTSSRFWPFRRQDESGGRATTDSDSDSDSGDGGDSKRRKRLPDSLKHNLPLPSTGEEAMKRLLGCKGKDPYSILGVSQDCTDDDIKKYYKRQAFLVHPDKNNQPGAEEAFKILVHAFCIIGEPEHRKSYDRSVEKTAQAQQAWSQISELLAQLHKKMEYVANTIRCTNCGKRHKRTLVNRPIYAARMCAQCKIHHSVREGEIWAETRVFGLRWRYYACMDGAVYDISEWAGCQGSNLKNLKANTHQVQYRIVLEKHANKNRSQQSPTSFNEPGFQEFINNLYSTPDTGNGTDGQESAGRNRKQKRKK